jgi:hypothetical protein
MIDPKDLAYPVNEYNGDGSYYTTHTGLTIRAEFAARAMQGFIVALGMGYHGVKYSTLTACSVEAADALIADLNKEPPHDH